MSAHQAWLEAPYQAEAKAAEQWEAFCEAHEDDLRAELQANPDDIMREEVAEYVAQNLQQWTGNKLPLLRGMRLQFEESLKAAVKRALEAKWRALS